MKYPIRGVFNGGILKWSHQFSGYQRGYYPERILEDKFQAVNQTI